MQTMAQAHQDERDATADIALTADMDRMAAALDAKVAAENFDTVDAAAARRLFAALVKVYSLRTEAGEREPPLELGQSTTNATDVMITASALLHAGDLQVFELGMWQSYTRFV